MVEMKVDFPALGMVGALLVGQWSLRLLRETSRVLLNYRADRSLLRDMRQRLETDGRTRVQ